MRRACRDSWRVKTRVNILVEMQHVGLVALWVRSVSRVMPDQATRMPSWLNGWACLDEEHGGGTEQGTSCLTCQP